MTDRRLRAPDDFDGLAFDDTGLVPVVAQDAHDGRVLMLAWANREALRLSLESGEVHFWSRSRGELWRKGATSGHTLALVGLYADCDGDALLALVRPAGPACHTGEATCFGEGAGPRGPGDDALDRLAAVIDERALSPTEASYTSRLLADRNLRLKKLGEETAELIVALATEGDADPADEAADLIYHVLVALRARDRSLADVRAVLAARRSAGPADRLA
jgi:phosphoribosyl-AMP cyclohydrolase / phosphoribosyl-ATP pyrophosphohydrolase